MSLHVMTRSAGLPNSPGLQQEEQEEEERTHLLRVVFRAVESDREGDLEARVKGGLYRRP